MITEEFAKLFDGSRREGQGFAVKCPCHDDLQASLSINTKQGGGILMHCHAGCKTADILETRNLTMNDLTTENVKNFSQNGRANGKPQIVATYDYCNPDGSLELQAVRFDPKGFRQRCPKPDGGWNWSVKGCAVLPYRLPELLAADPSQPVFVVEGEKDADRLASLELVATCNIGGAGKFKAEHAEYLRDRDIVVLSDNDDAGSKHTRKVAELTHGLAKSVKVVELPGLNEKEDVSNWLDGGGTAAKLLELSEASEEWKPTAKSRTRSQRVPVDNSYTNLKAPAARTDLANAKRFIGKHGEITRWCEQFNKWLVWNSQQWAIDSTLAAPALAKKTAEDIWNEAGRQIKTTDGETKREIMQHAKTTASARGIGNILSLARSEPGIPIQPAALDSHPWQYNCKNGTIDLKTGQLGRHDRSQYITKLCPTEFLTANECECRLWDSFLLRIFDGDLAMIGFVKRLFGSALVGQVIEHILPILWGSGANGKSVLIETLFHVLGPDFACKAAPDLLMVKHGNAHPTERADLHGKRLVVAVETDEGRRLAEGLVKELTGADTVKARRMREDFWSFVPSHTAMLVTNHKPTIRGTDNGIWRRLRLVPFTVTIPDDEQDKHLTDKLKLEAPGILRWLVDGCLEWQQQGLDEPEQVTNATASYRGEMDTIGEFVDECCMAGEAFKVKSSSIYKAYSTWMEARGEHPKTNRVFGEAMTERGFDRHKSNGTWYRGVCLSDHDNTPEEWT